jgi:hypothetical protein
LPKRNVEGKQSGGQGFFCIWHGLTFRRFRQLMAERPPMHWKWSLKIASIAVASVINSIEAAIENLRFGRAIERTPITEPPVFILGHWRSGTTLLHNLMALDPQFTYPNMYEVLFPSHFLTTEKLVTWMTGWLVPKTRPMDNMPAAWNMPQEDELALLLLCGHSGYQMLAFPGLPSKFVPLFDPDNLTGPQREELKAALLFFMKKLTYKQRRAVLLKSPTHTFRVPMLLEMFPNAKFVYIHRHPYEVYRSTLHLRRAVITDNSLAPFNFHGYEEEAFQLYESCLRKYEATKHLIPAGQLHELGFDALEADPYGELKQIYEALNLAGWETVEPAIKAQLPELARYRKNSFSMDETSMRRIDERLHWAFDLYGYDSGLPEAQPRRLSAVG